LGRNCRTLDLYRLYRRHFLKFRPRLLRHLARAASVHPEANDRYTMPPGTTKSTGHYSMGSI
jgi:hypothetical protein